MRACARARTTHTHTRARAEHSTAHSFYIHNVYFEYVGNILNLFLRTFYFFKHSQNLHVLLRLLIISEFM